MKSLHPFFSETETPCVGICSTIYGDEVCRGCFRTCQEVIDWNTYPDPAKLCVLNRLNETISKVMQDKIIINDAELLKQKCAALNVKIRLCFNPFTWAHALLRAGIYKMQDLSKYGLAVQTPYAHLTVAELIEMIDDELHHVSHHSL